jgi:putative membrane protein
MMHMFGGYGGMGYGGVGMIFMFLFWGFIIALVVMLVRKATSKPPPKQQDTPIDIAKRRYARGKISKQEFDHLIRELQ